MSVTSSGDDYSSSTNMITHIVLFRIREDVPASTIERIFGEIGALQSKIAGVLSYAWGPYSSPEGFGRGCTHGFYMTFVNAEARDAYLPHPERQKVWGSVSSIVDGGIDGVLAFDFAS